MRARLENEEIFAALSTSKVAELPWNHHPTFKGVHLKHLLKGADTDGRFSYHLVHVEAGCAIGDHIHESQIELHQVIEGRGVGLRADEAIAYRPGVAATMPQGVLHAVKAEDDLYILATFVPPLV